MKLRQAEPRRPLSQKVSMGEGENQVFPELGAISVGGSVPIFAEEAC